MFGEHPQLFAFFRADDRVLMVTTCGFADDLMTCTNPPLRFSLWGQWHELTRKECGLIGGAWGDAAAGFYHEAQLRRASAQLQPGRAQALRASAERLIRGAITCSTASGACSVSASQRGARRMLGHGHPP